MQTSMHKKEHDVIISNFVIINGFIDKVNIFIRTEYISIFIDYSYFIENNNDHFILNNISKC